MTKKSAVLFIIYIVASLIFIGGYFDDRVLSSSPWSWVGWAAVLVIFVWLIWRYALMSAESGKKFKAYCQAHDIEPIPLSKDSVGFFPEHPLRRPMVFLKQCFRGNVAQLPFQLAKGNIVFGDTGLTFTAYCIRLPQSLPYTVWLTSSLLALVPRPQFNAAEDVVVENILHFYISANVAVSLQEQFRNWYHGLSVHPYVLIDKDSCILLYDNRLKVKSGEPLFEHQWKNMEAVIRIIRNAAA